MTDRESPLSVSFRVSAQEKDPFEKVARNRMKRAATLLQKVARKATHVRHVNQGRLEGQTFNGRWWVTTRSVDQYLEKIAAWQGRHPLGSERLGT